MAKRAKYQVIRKEKTDKEYEDVKVIVDGTEKKVSKTSKYLLDMLITDEE